jgi:hypothetical protein
VRSSKTSGVVFSRSWVKTTPEVLLIYTLIAVVMTWPLATHLGTRLAADVGDPAFNCWVLAWTAGQVLAALRGDFAALASYWHGNIFSPEPLTLAYSEHLTAEMLQILPVYAATGNILLSYNLLFIASFALSGIAMYLLVREITSQPLAAFLAGLAFAYAPYRLGQFSHLQVLTSYWMPLVIAGLHRYVARTAGANSRAALKPLAGASMALVFQNLSCGYYMLFFAPFVAAYSLFEMARRRLLRSGRTWLHLSLAAAAVLLLTWPFVRPYLQLRELGQLGVRSREEIALFSADAHAFGTIAPNSRLLAETLTGYPRAEGEGFVGFTILAFAIAGAVWAVWRILRRVPWSTLREWHVLALGASGVLLAGSTAALGWYFVHGQIAVTSGGGRVIYQSATQPLHIALGSLVVFVALVAAARPRVIQEPAPDPDRQSRVLETTTVFFLIALAFAALLALGPRMQALGRDLGPGPYQWLLDYVPGFNGLRVPARFLMLVAMCLAVLAGIGAAALLATRFRRAALVVMIAGAAGMLAESWVAPLQMNQPVIPAEGFRRPPPPAAGRRVPSIYNVIRDLPEPVVLAEFPFGEPAYEVLAVFYAGHHRRPLVNGYSGFFPRSYLDRAAILHGLPHRSDQAAVILRAAGVTHVLVHEAAFIDTRGREISEWLLSLGARPVTEHESDKLFILR